MASSPRLVAMLWPMARQHRLGHRRGSARVLAAQQSYTLPEGPCTHGWVQLPRSPLASIGALEHPRSGFHGNLA